MLEISDKMISIPRCVRCANFLSQKNITDDWKCKAFPEGIPYEHYAFMNHWNPPENCNNSIGYEKKVEENPEYIVPKK